MLPFGMFVPHLLTRRSGLFSFKCHKRRFAADNKNQTMSDIYKKLLKMLKIDQQYYTVPKSRDHLMKFLPKNQSELPVRKMKDSFDTAIVPLSSEVGLRNRYTTFYGTVRLGRIMEDVDMFAGHLALKHVMYPASPDEHPIMIVTVAMNDIVFYRNLQPFADIRLSGHVSWVGTSSLEVIIWMEQEINGKQERFAKALLLMAARNPNNTGSAIVNAVEAETEEERELLQHGKERKEKRLKLMKQSLLKTIPTQEELTLVHELFIDTIDPLNVFQDTRILPDRGKWMKDATLSNLILCHPEHRNLYNKIFGGFLIRQALELSWVLGFSFGTMAPQLLRISDISFICPVNVGAFLRLHASVTFTQGHFAQIFVNAVAYDGMNEKGLSTTTFNFTYKFENPPKSVFPETYFEAMRYIEGRRVFKDVLDNSLKEQ